MKTVRNYPYKYKIYTKEQIDTLLDEIESEIPDVSDYYTKTETDTLLDGKQGVLTAGTNVNISNENVISAVDTVYTAGTGINIDADNVISATGGSGGTWTKRTPNNDWTDLFEVDGSAVKPKKDILFVDSNSKCEFYAMKGKNNTSGYFEIVFNAFGYNDSTQDVYKFYKMNHIMVTSGNLSNSSSSFTNYYDTIEITVNQGSITNVATGSYFGNGFNKSSFNVYTKE